MSNPAVCWTSLPDSLFLATKSATSHSFTNLYYFRTVGCIPLMKGIAYNRFISKYEQLKAKRATIEPHVYLDPNFPIIRFTNPHAVHYDYHACPAVNSFLHDRNFSNKIILGGFGTGKTTAILHYILWRAVRMPACSDGVRRYKCVLVRNTSGELESTVLQTWLDWMCYLPRPIGRENNKIKHNPNYYYEIYDRHGLIELHLFFLALDREDASRKLDSLELSDVFVGEARHVAWVHIEKLLARMGRYPKKVMFNHIWQDYLERHPNAIYQEWFPYRPQLLCDSNPPPEGHWIQRLEREGVANFELANPNLKVAPIKVYHQPKNIIQGSDGKWRNNPAADNVKYQSPTYWLEMLNNGIEFAKVYAQGEYGLTRDGNVVFPQFNSDLHIASTIDVLKDVPLFIIFDISLNALTPACLIMQQSPSGQLRCLKEFCTDRSSTRELAEDVVLPYIDRHFSGLELGGIIRDPASEAGNDLLDLKLQTGTILDEIFGMPSLPAKTNKLKPRLDAVTYYLTRLFGGQPGLLISKAGCPILIEAFVAKYIYALKKVIGVEEHQEKPRKTHPHSDIMDCCQYGCCEFGGQGPRQITPKDYNLNYRKLLANSSVM